MIHLHCHNAKGSILDSTNKPEELPVRAKELGMSSLAITDHGTMYAMIDFYKACKRAKVKPIMGCEVYVCDDVNVKDNTSKYEHLVLLAETNEGFVNLKEIVTKGFMDGFYYKPRVDDKILRKYSEGIIALSACLGGRIPRMIMKGAKESTIVKAIEDYKKIFKSFYLEVQSANNPDQRMVNQELVKYASLTNTPLVATSDVHFLRKEDFETHGIFIQINQSRDNEVYQDCWLKSEEEVFEVLEPHIGFEATIEAIANTHAIADQCNVEIELGHSYLPKFDIPKEWKNEDEYLKHLINKGIVERGINKKNKLELQKYIDRLKEELEVITAKGFSGYFLIVQDFLQSCREEEIYTGDGRGSADNSLVCYVLGITNVDSIEYDLNFSRFLTMERVSLPDVDMDLQSSRKSSGVDIIRKKYGHENVAQICTFGVMQAKTALNSVGSVLDIPTAITKEVSKLIPDGVSLEDALKKSSLKKIKETGLNGVSPEQIHRWFSLAEKLEGLPKTVSVHAGGVVICPSDRRMSEFTPLAVGKEGQIITQLEMHDVEEVGLVKMDVLATITLDVIDRALDLIFGGKNRR